MIVLFHYDWNGTTERLEEYTRIHYEMAEKLKDAKFLGRYAPWNKKYNWTHVWEMKDFSTLHEKNKIDVKSEDWKEFGHGEMEVYSGPIQ